MANSTKLGQLVVMKNQCDTFMDVANTAHCSIVVIICICVFQPSRGEQAEGEPVRHPDSELVQRLQGAGLPKVQSLFVMCVHPVSICTLYHQTFIVRPYSISKIIIQSLTFDIPFEVLFPFGGCKTFRKGSEG